MTVLIEDLLVGESVRWHEGRVWFAHWGAGEIVAATLTGEVTDRITVPTTIPFSIDWLPDGRLLVICGPERRLLVQAPSGGLELYADLSDAFRYSFNELVVAADGGAYLDGGGFDMMAGEPFAPGIVVRVAPDGTARQVADGIHFGNGMAITADGRTLLVAESYAKRLSAFTIAPDGSLGDRRVWADLGDGVPDGISLDAEGACWVADVPNRRCVRVAEGGAQLAAVDIDRGCFSCAVSGGAEPRLLIAAAEWRGAAQMFTGARTGRLLSVPAPLPRAGRP